MVLCPLFVRFTSASKCQCKKNVLFLGSTPPKNLIENPKKKGIFFVSRMEKLGGHAGEKLS